MPTATDNPDRTPTTRLMFGAVVALSIVIALTYYFTFYGSSKVETQRNSIAFADTGEYVQLLRGRHYIACLGTTELDRVEHRRKTIHHLDYLVVADVVSSLGTRAAGLDEVSSIWLVTPLLGAINFALAFLLFRRESGQELALPAALAYAVIPATWIYAAVPETWIISGTAVLVILLLRGRGTPSWLVAILIALFALNNFLLLALVALVVDVNSPADVWIRKTSALAVLVVTVWLGFLIALGLTLSPDFLPHHFVAHTIAFKERLAENLSIVHPMRWAYNAANGWFAPFVLNQPDLNFGRYAMIDSVRTFPLGSIAVAVQAFVVFMVGRDVYRQARAHTSWSSALRGGAMGTSVYLVVIFIATGLALYYESFLYAQMFVPILFLLLLRALPPGRTGVGMMWVITIAWGLNSAQQMLSFRAALGL